MRKGIDHIELEGEESLLSIGINLLCFQQAFICYVEMGL